MSNKKNELNKSQIATRHFPSSVREWNNSIYTYNKNTLSSIPNTTVSVMKMMKNYFDFFNKWLEKKVRSKGLFRRYRRTSSNKIYFSRGEFKHTNNKVLINVYLYNRQKYNYLSKLRKNYLRKMLKENSLMGKNSLSRSKTNLNKKTVNTKIIKNLRSIYKECLHKLKQVNNSKYLLIKILRNNPSYNVNTFKNVSDLTVKFYKNVLRKSMKKLFMYFFYRQLMLVNRSKLNYTYLQSLKLHLEKLYNKNVEFNLINLKNIYLNSDIMSEVARLKLTRNRRRLLKLMNKMKNKLLINKRQIKLDNVSDSKVSNLSDLRSNNSMLKDFVVDSLKYKHITGYRLEAKGRLTRRHKAARAISKARYKGNLSNIDASFKGLSTVLLKGNLKPNLQYTKSYSKTKIGAFGIKGWVSSY